MKHSKPNLSNSKSIAFLMDSYYNSREHKSQVASLNLVKTPTSFILSNKDEEYETQNKYAPIK